MANWTQQRCQGKTEITVAATKAALDAGKRVIIAVPDQQEGVRSWSKRMPGYLFSMVAGWGIRPHRRSK